MIDSHIHLDWYTKKEQKIILHQLEKFNIEGLIAVSSNLASCKAVWKLSQSNRLVSAAFGWHPEQPLPANEELEEIGCMIRANCNSIVAIGEVGLPYYMKQSDPALPTEEYVRILESFLSIASELDLPIVLHAIYEDADFVCELLEKYQLKLVHFHWFKGSKETMKRMVERGYMISITPDCLYEDEIREIIQYYPLELIMVETDGPWRFEGPFSNQMTHPKMMKASVKEIAALKKMSEMTTEQILARNTRSFYRLG